MVARQEIDWAGLFHSRGSATDVAAQLEALCGTDRDACFDASMFVWSRLFANGMLTPATAAALPLLAGMLDDPALGAGDQGVRTVCCSSCARSPGSPPRPT
jgi:hypothetical protein